MFDSQQGSFSDKHDICKAKGGYLAKVDTLREISMVKFFIERQGKLLFH